MIELLLICASFVIGWFARELYAHYLIDKFTKSLSNTMVENLEKNIIDITVEKHEGYLFVYQKDNGAFLAQGKDLDELSDVLIKKYPGKFFNTSSKHMKLLEEE